MNQEAVYQQLKGVLSVVSGYSGGHVENPTYKEVCTGKTSHAEVCQIKFDPEQISFEELLKVYFEIHDPTTLNRQGNDVGTQYRSVIFYHSEEQKMIAERLKNDLNVSEKWKNPIVTEITPYSKFYPAEDYHQNYYMLNGNKPYCSVVITPKVKKFKEVFYNKLKK